MPLPAGSSFVQIGAFSQKAQAERRWNELTRRVDYLGKQSHRIESFSRQGATTYRLRVAAANKAEARTLCSKLESSGVKCFVVP